MGLLAVGVEVAIAADVALFPSALQPASVSSLRYTRGGNISRQLLSGTRKVAAVEMTNVHARMRCMHSSFVSRNCFFRWSKHETLASSLHTSSRFFRASAPFALLRLPIHPPVHPFAASFPRPLVDGRHLAGYLFSLGTDTLAFRRES